MKSMAEVLFPSPLLLGRAIALLVGCYLSRTVVGELPSTCLTTLTTSNPVQCCQAQPFLEISFSLRFGCDVPHHLDEGVRLEIRTPAKRWQPIRYYTPSLTTPSASLVTLNEDNATVVAEALTYSSTFPLEVVRGNQLLVIHEYICDDAFWDTSVSIRWMQRYNDSSDFAANKSTWSLDNVSIVFWNGECRQEVLTNTFHNGSAVSDKVLYNIEAGSVGTLPCESTGNSQLYFSEGAGHKNTARRSITIHSLSVNISECQSIDLLPGHPGSCAVNVHECCSGIDVCSIGNINCTYSPGYQLPACTETPTSDTTDSQSTPGTEEVLQQLVTDTNLTIAEVAERLRALVSNLTEAGVTANRNLSELFFKTVDNVLSNLDTEGDENNETQAVVSAILSLLDTFALRVYDESDPELETRGFQLRVTNVNVSSGRIEGIKLGGNQITLPALGDRVKIASFFFKNLSSALPDNPTEQRGKDQGRTVPVISSSVLCDDCDVSNLTEPVRYQLSFSENTDGKVLSCYFYDIQLHDWSSDGCYMNNNLSNSTVVVCECTHLTHFTILLGSNFSAGCLSEEFRSYNWPDTRAGSIASAPCHCAQITVPGTVSRQCMQSSQGAKWSTEIHFSSDCNTQVSSQLCDLDVSAVNEHIVNFTSTFNLTSVEVVHVTAVLENLTLEAATNSEVRDKYLQTIDNIQQSDPDVLQESQMSANSSSRLLTSLETFLDNLDLSTVNQTSGSNRTVLSFKTFALQVEEINPDTFNGQTFTIALGSFEQARKFSNVIDLSVLVTVDGVVDGELRKVNRNSTATLQLNPMLFRSCIGSDTNTSSPQAVRLRLSYSVFLTDSLFLPANRTLNKVGSIVVAVRTKCQLENDSEAMPPVSIQSSFDVPDMNITVRSSCAVKGAFGAWDTKGCKEVTRVEGRVDCECTQVGHFGILLDLNPSALPERLSITVSIITYIGLALSLTCLAVFIFTIVASKKLRGKVHNHITANISLSLVGLYIAFFLGGFPTKIPPLCGVVSAVLHYFFLTFFAWTSVEAAWLYINLVIVFGTQGLTSRYTLNAGIPAWVLPAVIVAISAGVGHDYYTSHYYCRPTEWPFFFGLILPFLVVQIFNWIMFIRIMISIYKNMRDRRVIKASTTGAMSVRDLRKMFLVTMTLGVVLGLGWGIGLVATSSGLVALTFTFQVIFSIFVGSQGVLIFVFHGLRNEDFRDFWKIQPQKAESKFVFSSSFDKNNTAKVTTSVEHSGTLPKKESGV